MHFKYFSAILFALTASAAQAGQAVEAGTAVEVVDAADAVEEAEAITTRTAQATVQNLTGKKILGVSLIHKYSDNYVHNITWPQIEQGASGSPALTVKYHTGFGAFGEDWWLVTWLDENGNLYHTDPANGQCFINWLQKLVPGAISAAVKAIVALATDDTPLIASLAGKAVSLLIKPLLGAGDTCGFKENYLTKEDDSKLVTITLNQGGTARISSPSGHSDTVWDSVKIR